MPPVIRQLMPRDFPAVDPLLIAAYGSPTSMLDELARYYRLQPDGWITALRDERPVGMGGALLYGAHARIGLMAVSPELQQQGIGATIMRHLLQWSVQHGATTILLDATPAGAPLYTKLGFALEDTVSAYIQKQSYTASDALTNDTRQLQAEELPEVIKYDAGRLGVERVRVLSAYYEEFAGRTFVAHDGQGKIAGYLIAQRERRLGPWVADTPDIARSLLQHALRLPFAWSPMVLVPDCNQAAQQLLKEAGFLPGRQWQSMHLGGTPNLQHRQWLYGYANFYCG
ncbi:MAG TPA: GNAT family N-acetyltransferase [Ktedonobacteraceae bacterium]